MAYRFIILYAFYFQEILTKQSINANISLKRLNEW